MNQDENDKPTNLYDSGQKMKKQTNRKRNRATPFLMLLILFCLFGGVMSCNRSTPDADEQGTREGESESSVRATPRELAVRSEPATTVPTRALQTQPTQALTSTSEESRQPQAPSSPSSGAETKLSATPLDAALQSIEYGNTALARAQLSALLETGLGDPLLSAQIYFLQAKSYLIDGLYVEALTLLERLASENKTPQALNTGGVTVQRENRLQDILLQAIFVRGEALMGLGRYEEAIGAYEQFGESYPWMAEIVEQKDRQCASRIRQSSERRRRLPQSV